MYAVAVLFRLRRKKSQFDEVRLRRTTRDIDGSLPLICHPRRFARVGLRLKDVTQRCFPAVLMRAITLVAGSYDRRGSAAENYSAGRTDVVRAIGGTLLHCSRYWITFAITGISSKHSSQTSRPPRSRSCMSRLCAARHWEWTSTTRRGAPTTRSAD